MKWMIKHILLSLIIFCGGTITLHETTSAFNFIGVDQLNSPALVTNSDSTQGGQNPGATNDPSTTETEADIANFFEMLLKVMYLMLWPLLAIAGASLDNTLVYGDIFYLDKALWQFRQMIRTFANFALGFIFIASILISFVGAEKKFEKISVKTIIKKLFLAGVLINMSWFIVAALIDLSTVLVFSLGALPLHVVRDEPENEKVRYLTSHSFYNQDTSTNTNRDQVEHSLVYSCPGPTEVEVGPNLPNAGQRVYYLPCKVAANHLPPRGATDENQTRENWKQAYIDAWGDIGNGQLGGNISDDYCVRGYDLIVMEPSAELTAAKVKELRDGAKQELIDQECSTLDRLIEKAQGMTGPMYTLFATILRMGEIGVTINNKTVVEKGLEFLMRVFVGIALILPLVALAVVLVVRAVILWLIIAFSPLLVLVYVFGFKTFGGEKSELKSVLGLIFLPVYAVFAVSISILFLSLIGRIDLIEDTDTCKDDTFSILTSGEVSCPNDNQKCYKLFDITEICFTESQANTGSNIISIMTRLTVNFFGIALMRMIIFTALKSNKITGSIAGKIETFGKGLAGSLPIVPLPTGMTSIGALGKSASYLQGVPDRIATQQFNQGLGEEIEAFAAKKDAKNTNTALAEKVSNAAKGQPTTFNKSDFQLPDDTNHTQYPSLGPSLGLASSKSYDDAKSMSFKDAYSDPQTIKYMQENGLYNTGTRVKNGGDGGIKKKVALAKDMEEKLASTGGKTLGADSSDVNATRYALDGYVTKFPRGNSSKGLLRGDVENIQIVTTPQKKADRDKFSRFFHHATTAGIRNNTEFTGVFAGYMGLINQAITNGGAVSWVDSQTDPANPKTHTITANGTIGAITGFTIN